MSTQPSPRSGMPRARTALLVIGLGLVVAVGGWWALGPAGSPSKSSGPDLGSGVQSASNAAGGSGGTSGSPNGSPANRLTDSASPPPSSSGSAAAPSPTIRPTARPTPRPAAKPAATPRPVAPRALSACPIFPSTNVWNRRVDGLPVAADSDAMIAAIGGSAHLHPDFSNAGGYGIPFNVVGTSTVRASVRFQYASESDRVRYPIPMRPRIEGGSDRHLLMIDTNACRLYELYDAVKTSSGWQAGSGAVWNLRSNALRPDGWTSADAAGLPIFPGLVRYDEVARGVILHALRFTAPATCSGHLYPARHDAGSGSCSSRPPMGLRVRLKASVDISGFGRQARVLLTALKRFGMILADNGSPWYVTGAPDPHWNDDVLHALGQLSGTDFEVVDTSALR